MTRVSRQLPSSIPGELAIAGGGVARGYLGRPGLTAQRFADTYATPLGTPMPQVMITAHTLSSLIQGDLLRSTEQHLLIWANVR